MMHYFFIPILLILFLNGCQEKKQHNENAQAEHDAKIAAQTRAEVLAEFQATKLQKSKESAMATQGNKNHTSSQNNTIPKPEEKHKKSLEQMGIEMKKETITIDTNKTKKFLNNLSNTMEIQMKKISDDLKKGIMSTKQAGIEMNEKHIHIDLNKTQNMLNEWKKKIEVFVQEFDTIEKNLELNTTDKGK